MSGFVKRYLCLNWVYDRVRSKGGMLGARKANEYASTIVFKRTR